MPAAPVAPAQEMVCGAREPQVQADTLRPSLRDGLRLIRALLGEPAFATVALAKPLEFRANLAPAPGAPGPHDFAVRSTASPGHPAVRPATAQEPEKAASNIASPSDAAASIAFRPTFRDVGDTPLRPGRNEGEYTTDRFSVKRKYFLMRGLTVFCGARPTGKSPSDGEAFLKLLAELRGMRATR